MIHVMERNGFRRCERDGMVFYRCAALDSMADVRHGFSSRRGTSGSLNLTHFAREACRRVEENRLQFMDAVGLSGLRLVTLSQIHSDKLHIIGDEENWERIREGDALATQRFGVALGVQVADCFPIILADPSTGVVAAVHSGWRGTVARILGKTIEGIKSAFGIDPASLIVVIGPGIRSCCMQVGPEVAVRYEAAFPDLGLAIREAGSSNRYLLDMPRALLVQSAEAGIRLDRIFDMGACTRCRTDEFFSYRAEGATAGRMMAVIGRLPGSLGSVTGPC